jgi:hypothetical protein
MTRPPLGFKRLVLGLQGGASSRSMRLAVEFAERFDLELLGLFIDDSGLRNLAGIPFARAISSVGGGWSQIGLPQMIHDLDLAASGAERRFVEAARKLARRQFEVARGGVAEAIAEVSRSGDLLVIGAPATAAAFAAEPFASLLEAVFDSTSPVMLAPARLARDVGSVVAIAGYPGDPSVDAAAAVADALGEDLVVIESRDGVATRRGAETRLAFAADAAPQALHGLTERLVVATRGVVGHEAALAIATSRGVPVLSIIASEEWRGDRTAAD